MKNNIKKDNSLLPLCRQDTKKEKELRAKASCHLLVVLSLLVVTDILLTVIVVIINSSRTEGPTKTTKGGVNRDNQNSSRELGLYPKIDPTRSSSNSVKTT
jgi:hypothetical protein